MVNKKYWRLKYSFSIFETFYLLLILFFSLYGRFSDYILDFILKITQVRFWVIAIYLLLIYLIYYLLVFPFHFYEDFIWEHKFSLSNQGLLSWFKDEFKKGIIFYILSLILFEFFYFSLNFSYGWILVSFFWIIITIVLAKILPTLIIPLFFKYKKITDQSIYQMIMDLAQKMRIKILDIFEIDLSKMTLKANAGLAGLGKNKRVILADTLKDRYSPDEIKVILAHEFAHQKFSHLLKILFLEAIFITFNFYLIFKTVDFFLKKFNLKDIKDLSCLPLIFIYLIILEAIENPIKNFISRNFERNADRLAIKTTGLKDAFISLMEKLAQQNLSDTSPHPLIKIFFFNHPPIEERINLAKSLRDQG